jgi:large subunit ribosomal protein L32
MTPLPKRRLSRQRQGKRRAAIKLQNPTLTKCPNCGIFKKPPTACPSCGQYKGKQVIEKREKKKKGNHPERTP